jgi:hypothetical protein
LRIQVRIGRLNMGSLSVMVAGLGRLAFHHGGAPSSTKLSTRPSRQTAKSRQSLDLSVSVSVSRLSDASSVNIGGRSGVGSGTAGRRQPTKAAASRAAPARREKSGEGTCAVFLVPFRNVPLLAGDLAVDRRRLSCRLAPLPKPGCFPCLITRRRGVRLCLMARRTFLAGT